MSRELVNSLTALQSPMMLSVPCMPALLMPLALEMVATLLWALLVKVVSVRFLERQLMAGMLLGLLVGDMVEVLVEAAAGRLILLLIGVLETGHLEAEVVTEVLLGLQQMNGASVWMCLLLQQLPLRLMAEQDLLMICVVMSLMIHKLRLQLLPELLPMQVHVQWLLLSEMP